MTSNMNHYWLYVIPDSKEDSVNHSYYIKVPPQYYEQLMNELLTIKYGDKQIDVPILRSEVTYQNVIYSSNQLLELLLNNDKTNHSLYSAMLCTTTRTLTFGPILGVLTEISQSNLFPSIRSFCEEVTDYTQKLGVFCHIYSKKTLLNEWDFGYTYQNKQWIKQEVPYPHFLYNRIHSRKTSYSKAFLKFCDELSSKYISIYNRLYFSKQDMYEYLLPSTLAPYIPEGRPFEMEDFLYMIRKYSVIFAKPIYGSKGHGIIRIQKSGPSITLEHQDQSKYETSSLKEAWKVLQLYTNQRPYWFQEGISLITYKNQNVDFRIVTHLTAAGDWISTSTTARLSEEGGFITNLSQGGKKISASRLLQVLFGQSRGTSILKIMDELAIETSKRIDQTKSNSFIELGIDIAVDQSGKVYLLEINSKPSKDDIENNTSIRPSAKKISEIAIAKGKSNMEEGCLCKLSESLR